jgi:hypothetical protein
MLSFHQALFDRLPERLSKAKANKRSVTSRKRSLPAPKSSSSEASSGKSGAKGLSQHRQSEKKEATKTSSTGSREARLARMASFDGLATRDDDAATQTYLQNYQGADLFSLDASAAQPQGGGISGEGQPTSAFSSVHSQAPVMASNPIYKLDAMMFPSGDPFAYPTQPLVGMATAAQSAITAPSTSHSGSAPGQRADVMQFYMPNLYEDIDSHLLGSMPPYLVQPGLSASQQGIPDMTGHFYDAQDSPDFGGGGGAAVGRQQRQQHQGDLGELEMATHPGFRARWDMAGHSFQQL